MKKNKFLTIFPLTENIHLTKDVGQIPFVFNKEFNFESTIATYKNDNINYIQNDIPGVKFIFINKIFKSENLNILFFILFNFWKFNIIQFYHISITKMLIGILYKILFFGKSKVFIKMDANSLLLEDSTWNFIRTNLYRILTKFINVISVENTIFYKFLLNKIKLNNIFLLPNGYLPVQEEHRKIYEKSNIFISVGRLGDENKAHHIAIKAFKLFYDENKNWKLILIGPIANDFLSYYNKFLKENPQLNDKIILTGSINNREKINEYYRKAKILLLTSISEGFPLVFAEAISNSCLIISSELPCAYDVTNNATFGAIFKQLDEKDLFEKMKDVEKKTDVIYTNDYLVFKNRYNWINLLKEIYLKLK